MKALLMAVALVVLVVVGYVSTHIKTTTGYYREDGKHRVWVRGDSCAACGDTARTAFRWTLGK